jgi:hypothetical protein
MPDTPPIQPNPTPAPSSPTPPSGTPTSDSGENLANMVAPEYRYPDNPSVPEYLRGKTAGDAAQLLAGLVDSVGKGINQPPQAQPPALQSLGDDDYVTTAHLRQAQANALSQVSPWLAQVADQQATVSYNISKREHPEIFKKYEPEVIKVLQSVPRQNWTLDVIEKAVTFVKGSHVDEITAEKVRALESTMNSTMRSTGRAGMSSDVPLTETVASSLGKTPPQWLARARAAGIDENSVWEFCKATDTTVEEFFQQFSRGMITDAVAEVGRKHSP